MSSKVNVPLDVMASNAKRGMTIFNCQRKMLVLFILFVNTAHFCQGKALLEEAESNRGKRLYDHPNSGLHQTYDPLSNAEHWMNEKFYEPQVDGQPIYIPAIGQPKSYNEFLDAYYKAYTPASSLATPAPHAYSTKNTKEIQTTSTSDKKNLKYTLSTSKQKEFSVDMSTLDSDLPEDFNSEVEDKTIATILNKGKPDALDELEKDLTESLKHTELPKTKVNDNQYSQPVVLKIVKQKVKTNNEKDVHKNPNESKSGYKNTEEMVIEDASDKNDVMYESPPSKERVVSVESKFSSNDYDLEPEDYDDSDIVDKSLVTEFNNEKSDLLSELEDKFEEPVIRESLKSELTETKLKHQYDMPIVVKTVKQKPKTNNAKDLYKNPSKPPKSTYVNTKTVIKESSDKNNVKCESPDSKESEFLVEISTSQDLEYEDYDNPKIIDKTVATELNRKSVMTSELKDKFEEPVVIRESLESELSKTDSNDYNLYDAPVVVKTKQKSKTNNVKKTQEKQNTQNTKPQLESDCIQQTVKAKPNKKQIKTASEPKYGDQTSRGTLKKSKGKRRNRYSKPNSRTTEAVNQKVNFDLNTRNEKPDEFNTQTETYKVVTNKSGKTKVNVAVKSDSKNNKTSKPLFVKEKVTVKSDIKDEPEKGNVKYDTGELEKEDLSARNLNSLIKDLSERDINIGNTNNLLEEEPDLGSLGTSETDFSEKLDTLSTTIKSDQNLESSDSGVLMKPESVVPNMDFRGLSSMNSNIWSMLFNPNAEQNKLKLKRCITRSNETGFCTYIQNCEVPHIASSLEQLLNNACVIDDIFIGVCCPEFPVQTVKVQWDQTPSDFDNPIEDEFGHIAEDCGIRSNKASELQSWPWKAPLVSMSNGKIFCGGVVVSEDHVLTAAHCTTKIPKNQILVRLGQYDDESGDDYAVVEIKRHAQYNPRTMQNDIALLKLGRRIMNDAHIGIVCLPDEEQQNNHNGEIATLLGWRGIFGTKSRDPEFLKVISNKECENKLGMKVLNTSLCTETRKESERTCNADSGAPLVIEDDGRYEVIGILSWNRNDCDQRFPSTFSRVSSYTGWIKNHIG